MALTAYTVNVTAAGSAHTKGAYSEVVASTPYASSRLYLTFRSSTVGPRRLFLVDLATGAVGVETVVVANCAVEVDADFLVSAFVPLTLDIPSGTRLSMRCQSSSASEGFSIQVLLENRALGSLTAPVTYGAVTASTLGTQIDPGGTANTKGSYVQLSAATSARIDALAICVTIATAGGVIATFTEWALDVATGAASAESVILPDQLLLAGANADWVKPATLWFPLSIAAGTRLAVRCSCNRTTSPERLLAVTLIGMQDSASGGGGSAGAVAYVG